MCVHVIRTCPGCGRDTDHTDAAPCSGSSPGFCVRGKDIVVVRLPLTAGNYLYCTNKSCPLHRDTVLQQQSHVHKAIIADTVAETSSITPANPAAITTQANSAIVGGNTTQATVGGNTTQAAVGGAGPSVGTMGNTGVSVGNSGDAPKKTKALRWSDEDGELLYKLKEENLSWEDISKKMNNRFKTTALQSKYQQIKKIKHSAEEARNQVLKDLNASGAMLGNPEDAASGAASRPAPSGASFNTPGVPIGPHTYPQGQVGTPFNNDMPSNTAVFAQGQGQVGLGRPASATPFNSGMPSNPTFFDQSQGQVDPGRAQSATPSNNSNNGLHSNSAFFDPDQGQGASDADMGM